MKRNQHAKNIASRFRELVEQAGHRLPEEQYAELALLIEAGIDTALIEALERTAKRLDKLAKDIRHSNDFFD